MSTRHGSGLAYFTFTILLIFFQCLSYVHVLIITTRSLYAKYSAFSQWHVMLSLDCSLLCLARLTELSVWLKSSPGSRASSIAEPSRVHHLRCEALPSRISKTRPT